MTTKNVTDRIAERMDAECPLSKSIDDVGTPQCNPCYDGSRE